eukprot:TRINITY_DN9025_c0_g1_i1.p1 TRINITY_DN9025_c0_g1~~TRINITY_DN9025_c0_g1_i1.p1  ORF type:complete len:301 (-),score=30.95 TRINITY_DN9025_c0_g1_i1:97-999(-)
MRKTASKMADTNCKQLETELKCTVKQNPLLFEDDEETDSKPGNPKILGVIFLVAIVAVVVIFRSFPHLPPEEREMLKFPRKLEDIRPLADLLLKYRDNHYAAVLSGFCTVYLFLQMFAIPGSIFLSILAGPLFGVLPGLILVSVLATCGSATCYVLSFYLGRALIERLFPSLLGVLRHRINKQRSNLLFYLLFLRISPIVPNWFINVASPILGIPMKTFVLATFLGLIPANLIHVKTGTTINDLTSTGSGAFSWATFFTLFVLAFLALIPTLFKRKFEELDTRMNVKEKDKASPPPSARA